MKNTVYRASIDPAHTAASVVKSSTFVSALLLLLAKPFCCSEPCRGGSVLVQGIFNSPC